MDCRREISSQGYFSRRGCYIEPNRDIGLFPNPSLEEARREQTAAIAEARAALKSLPAATKINLVELLFHLGAIEAARGETAAARAAFLEALELDKDHAASREALEKLPSASSTFASL